MVLAAAAAVDARAVVASQRIALPKAELAMHASGGQERVPGRQLGGPVRGEGLAEERLRRCFGRVLVGRAPVRSQSWNGITLLLELLRWPLASMVAGGAVLGGSIQRGRQAKEKKQETSDGPEGSADRPSSPHVDKLDAPSLVEAAVDGGEGEQLPKHPRCCRLIYFVQHMIAAPCLLQTSGDH